jgi:hypothetical protein
MAPMLSLIDSEGHHDHHASDHHSHTKPILQVQVGSSHVSLAHGPSESACQCSDSFILDKYACCVAVPVTRRGGLKLIRGLFSA